METDVNRFIKAQERDFEIALTEIKAGKKKSHWMWYIFPQFKGLGYSETARFYAIQNIEEARLYLSHPILGQRLREITDELLLLQANDAYKIMGTPDDLKLKSSMTLFAYIDDSNESPFKKILDKCFSGEMDQNTINLINKENGQAFS